MFSRTQILPGNVTKVMLTLYWIVKWNVAETVPERASVHTRNATFGTIPALEHDYFAPFLKDAIPATERSTCSYSHCTGSVSATLRYILNIAQDSYFPSKFEQLEISGVKFEADPIF